MIKVLVYLYDKRPGDIVSPATGQEYKKWKFHADNKDVFERQLICEYVKVPKNGKSLNSKKVDTPDIGNNESDNPSKADFEASLLPEADVKADAGADAEADAKAEAEAEAEENSTEGDE